MIHSHQKVLVTGGTGFVAIHSILQLLNRGYQVRTTVRSLNSRDKIFEMLKNGGITDFSQLEFIETDLTSDKNWNEAMMGCQYVLHIASPIFLRLPKNEDEMIRPAVDGTLRVLKAARDSGVKRVVMTSNFGAVGYSHKDKNSLITEESWTDPNEKGLSTYNKSKVLAEKAAWDFIEKKGGALELSVINPMGIFGPSLNEDLSSGFELLKKLLDGSMKAIPDIRLGIVDVRDVAELHILAMEKPQAKGERFLALSGGTMSLMEIVKLLKEKMPYVTTKAPAKSLPTFIIRLSSIFNDQAKAILPLVGINRNASNKKAKTILGWVPRTNEEAVTASVISLIKWKNLNI
ncbi:SDR family oxidoreductase [Flavobacterium johnsoniae]|uniref:NAD-dependent epimerase/dehydratase n=1 Tax=Flavobacterium johnsoniae (strain ATCC 17061 / DSM 2064 / JCM 8514 / BCRC 14874 / CCUG 350202 / NBRC 14942 / NCIMB 11054 / UW101) TaxID=376686 RepID=A5FNN5_FLAJ1|nr:aldehyde reductase [Flavobacterium johnsoniae]ABQ03191.1 NAD-dependent epimerase/dehydratase [Flavobacterium johnsoniae UW101]OXG01382.1 aldehyde reductase [Flavobacterium johnsoniae UW101]WQG79948.1 aldehyde reductase [Flavobacterium johnsoniae UW101]SHL82601.1 Nucleoside-diphosphate-sugar epimerase [Flavobacterium johnsoniae]